MLPHLLLGCRQVGGVALLLFSNNLVTAEGGFVPHPSTLQLLFAIAIAILLGLIARALAISPLDGDSIFVPRYSLLGDMLCYPTSLPSVEGEVG